MGKVSKALKWAEVKNRDGIYNWKGTTKYGNRDLLSITPPEHTFGYLAYFAFWTNSGTWITSFTLGSSYIAIGLNGSETIVACFLGGVISFVIGIFSAHTDKIILLDTYALHKFKVSRIEADAGGFNFDVSRYLFIGMTPCLPGFVMSCINPNAENVAVKIFQICWFISALLIFITYNALDYCYSLPGLGIRELIPDEVAQKGSIEVIDGFELVRSGEKVPRESTKTTSDQWCRMIGLKRGFEILWTL